MHRVLRRIYKSLFLFSKGFDWITVSGFYAGSHPLSGAVLDAEVLNHLWCVKREVFTRWREKVDGEKGKNMGK